MSTSNGNGISNGHHAAETPASRFAVRLLRRPTLALLRRYADWVERTSTVEVSGPGAAYAGSAVYLCRPHDVPVVFLHRAHYDDRTIIERGPRNDPLALFADAAGLIVSRSEDTPPEVERAVRAGNATLFIVGDDDAGRRAAAQAAALALRTRAPVIVLSGEAKRTFKLPLFGPDMGWPRPRNELRVTYGPLESLGAATEDAATDRILSLVRQ